MIPTNLGRFGRLQQTLLLEEKNQACPPKDSRQYERNLSYVKDASNPSESSENDPYVWAWLKICLSEGHIEPSQPSVGRHCGWPVRSFLIESLYTDFKCWRIKNGALPKDIASSTLFYSLVDRIFPREGQKYVFPSLEECRQKFKQLLQEQRK